MKMNTPVPFVIEKSHDGERAYDIYSRLLEDRIVFIGTDIDDDLANSIIAQLLLLDQKDSSRDIKLYINSHGGSVTAGLAILDTIEYIKADVMTVCVGLAASMGAVLLSSGAKGKRFALPNSRMMIHEPNQVVTRGQVITATEQEIDTKVFLEMRDQLVSILAKNTGHTVRKVRKHIDRDYWLTSEKAVEFGLIDSIIQNKPEN
jgi:ATP-dependent Clp protease protease subunit